MTNYFETSRSYGIWIYNHLCNHCLSPLTLEFESCSWQGVHDTPLCDKVSPWLTTGWWFSPGTPVFSTNQCLSPLTLNPAQARCTWYKRLCEKVVSSGRLFSPVTDRHNIMEILFKVAFNTITLISSHETTNCL